MPDPGRKSNFMRLALIVLLAAGSIGLAVLAFRNDAQARTQILSTQDKTWKKSAAYRFQGNVSRYGDWPPLMVFAAAGLFIAWRARNQEWKRILITAMIASTAAGMLVNTLRLTTGRTRPRESPKIAQAWVGPYHDGKITIGNSKYNSFPSGHTATAFGFAGVLFFARPLLGSFALLVAAAIAFSRLLLGAHHLSDVTVAALLALWVAWYFWRTAQRRGDAIARWVRQKISRRP
jgi:membrane-associated phospholipid phosphatase